jgi:hypothetical protein
MTKERHLDVEHVEGGVSRRQRHLPPAGPRRPRVRCDDDELVALRIGLRDARSKRERPLGFNINQRTMQAGLRTAQVVPRSASGDASRRTEWAKREQHSTSARCLPACRHESGPHRPGLAQRLYVELGSECCCSPQMPHRPPRPACQSVPGSVPRTCRSTPRLLRAVTRKHPTCCPSRDLGC